MSDITTIITTVAVVALPIIPIGHYLLSGWPTRRQQIVCRLTNESIAYYKAAFCPTSTFSDNDGFAKDYDARYGRMFFWGPGLSFFLTLLFLTYLCVSWTLSHDWATAGEGTAKIAIFSLAGAYVWITYDLIIRARQNDIVTSDINRATLRLLVSLPFGFAISAFAGVVTGSAVTLSTGALAFFVGAFPTDTVIKFMRRTAAVPLKLDADSSEDGVQQLKKIDGISVPIAERFIDEGVKTNLQLAYADPVALTIKSGVEFPFILMCCGQALVRVYFNDDQMKIVQKFGLRTPFEIKTLNDALLSYDAMVDEATAAGKAVPVRDTSQERAKVQLESFATELALDTASTRFILDQIAEDPYAQFLWWMWPDLPGLPPSRTPGPKAPAAQLKPASVLPIIHAAKPLPISTVTAAKPQPLQPVTVAIPESEPPGTGANPEPEPSDVDPKSEPEPLDTGAKPEPEPPVVDAKLDPVPPDTDAQHEPVTRDTSTQPEPKSEKPT